ncbi:MAG: S49 family peptidase [Marinobacter sp.]|nr:S49 family peptidase [Marinobacter sp.]
MSDWGNDNQPGWGAPKPSEQKPAEASAGGASQQAPVVKEQDQREWKLIEKLVLSMQSEQRKARRWGIFFKALTFTYLIAILFLIRFPMDGGLDTGKSEHTALIEVNGAIMRDSDASADNIVGALREAFGNDNAKAVVLRINSPGGSPVQAGYIYDEIQRLRSLHADKKVYAVISDIGASGAYYIAAAADEIYADRASLVGSIGVIAGGFGFTGAIEKLGIERRIYTAGDNKAFLDPFAPEDDRQVEFWQQVLDTTHRQFVSRVKEGRGDRLVDDERVFSGLIWSGEQALELGLVDGLGSSSYVARDIVGAERLVDYTRRPSPFRQLFDTLGVSVGRGFAEQMVQSRLELR